MIPLADSQHLTYEEATQCIISQRNSQAVLPLILVHFCPSTPIPIIIAVTHVTDASQNVVYCGEADRVI
jgi:hypothetical protein